MVLLRHQLPNEVGMFESVNKNKGLVNLWFIQYFKMSIQPQEFQSFWCVPSMSGFKMSIKPKEFQGFWCVPSMSDFKMSIKPKEFQ